MAYFSSTYKDFTRIAVPYYRSEDRWAGRVLLAAVIALQLFQVWLNVQFNAWYNTFYTALQDKDWLTQRYLGRWLGQGTHYRMRLKGDQADNPDQRIADDIRDFVDNTLNIGI